MSAHALVIMLVSIVNRMILTRTWLHQDPMSGFCRLVNYGCPGQWELVRDLSEGCPKCIYILKHHRDNQEVSHGVSDDPDLTVALTYKGSKCEYRCLPEH